MTNNIHPGLRDNQSLDIFSEERNCFDYEADVFFPGKDKEGIASAISICDGTNGEHPVCPQRETCRDTALQMAESFGVWGGVNFQVSRKDLLDTVGSADFKVWEISKMLQKQQAQSESIKDALAEKRFQECQTMT